MTFSIVSTGSFDKTTRFLYFLKGMRIKDILDRYGRIGVEALASQTPSETGLTAESWDYDVSGSGGNYKITWTNSNVHEGVPIAILIEYGHGTGTGGYVQPHDFINPAMRPVFDQIANDIWREVTSA